MVLRTKPIVHNFANTMNTLENFLLVFFSIYKSSGSWKHAVYAVGDLDSSM